MYALIHAGAGASIYTEPLIAQDFDSLADAHAFIKDDGLSRVQVIAISNGQRRWLTHGEQMELQREIVGAAA